MQFVFRLEARPRRNTEPVSGGGANARIGSRQSRKPARSSIALDDAFAHRFPKSLIDRAKLSGSVLVISRVDRLASFLDQGAKLGLDLYVSYPTFQALPVSFDD